MKNIVSDNQPRYDWKIGDKCWVSDDEGFSISDDSFEFVGDDMTLEIMSIYVSDGTSMSVIRRHPQGAHQCFRLEMLRPIKSKRDKVIDRTIEALNDDCIHCSRKIIERLYDEGMLNDEEVV